MPQVEALFDPAELRRCIRDLLALSTLPAILKTFDPYRIADSVAAALASMLDSDFVHILLPGKRDDPAIEIVRSGKRIAADSLAAIRAALRDASPTPSSERVLAVPNPIGEGVLRIVSAPIGLGDDAIIVVGSRRSDFPTAAQRLLLGIAANEATIALQRWQAEADARVRQTEQELRLVIDTIPAIVWRKLPDGSADFINQRFREYWGLSAEEGLGWGWVNGIHPDERKRFEEEWRAACAAGEPFDKESRLRRADGEYRRVLLRAVPRRDEDGNIVKWYGTTTDIEDHKRAETALRRSEAYLAEAQRLSLTGSFAWNVSRGEVFWSDEMYRILGFDRATKSTLGLCFICALAGKPQQPTRAVDPCAFQAKFVCRRDVGAQALPYLENSLTRNAERREVCNSGVEMRPVGLVGTDALRCDDQVEAEIEISARASQRGIIDVAERTDFCACLEHRQSHVAIRIGGPLMWSCGEGFPFVLVDRHAELRRDAIQASAQNLGIEVCRALFLDLSSSTIERHNEIVSRRRNIVLIGPSAEKDNDGGSQSMRVPYTSKDPDRVRRDASPSSRPGPPPPAEAVVARRS